MVEMKNAKVNLETYAQKMGTEKAANVIDYFTNRATTNRATKGSLSRFDEIMARQGGEAPIAGDQR